MLIGTGNNGGDGFVIGRTLLSEGYNVDMWLLPRRGKVKGDALLHLTVLENTGHQVYQLENVEILEDYDVIIDSMLGIGVSGPLRSPYKEVIEYCNQLDKCKIAVDIPSGVPADGNESIDLAFQANITITLQCPKLSAFTYPFASYYGKLITVDIGIPFNVIKKVAKVRQIWNLELVEETITNRIPESHKGSYGKALVIGGSKTMPGAPVMTVKAAHRSGAGLVTAAIPEEVFPMVASHVVEAAFSPWKSNEGHFKGETEVDLKEYNAIAIGPGLGRRIGAKLLVEQLLDEYRGPVVIDADGLFHLKDSKDKLLSRTADTILTPHSGEMARLTGLTVEEVEQRRFEVSVEFAKRHGVYLVLKGSYTIITTPTGQQFVNVSGNASLAKGGSGDVLTGIILAFSAHQKSIQAAICNAVYFHGKAAEALVKERHSMIDVLATDVVEALPRVFRTAFK